MNGQNSNQTLHLQIPTPPTQARQNRVSETSSGVPYLHFSDHPAVFDILEATSFSSFFSSISLRKALNEHKQRRRESLQIMVVTEIKERVIMAENVWETYELRPAVILKDQAIINKVFSTGLSAISSLREIATLHSFACQGGC
uniref:Uncharacterized protein n=1 Tax=Glossina austeni TaxID=7395 RepID=A0A1A9VIH4_GLOAU